MPVADDSPLNVELDDFIRAYELASGGESVDLAAFLPPVDHPLYCSVLRELVRIELERRWVAGRPRPLEEYRREFPQLAGDRETMSMIAFEEYRLRLQAGEDASPADYERRFGVDVTKWPGVPLPSTEDDPGSESHPEVQSDEPDPRPPSALLAEAAQAYLLWLWGEADPVGHADTPSWENYQGGAAYAEVFNELHRSDPAVTQGLARALTAMPQAGSEFLGFHLLAELGSGAFGRVYLSRQEELADRLVVVKIVPPLFGESRTLARLQHPNIVPIYSVHQADGFQAVCMPFLGRTTLAEILKDVRALHAVPHSGKYLIDRIRASSGDGSAASPAQPGEASRRVPTGTFAPLGNLTYVEAILWLAVRLADALAHAHGQGIVHRDLKPANILLTDDGRPMLLDFNLSDDDKLHRSASAARVGGTLPYMAPEQLAAFHSGEGRGDERSDIYSLGIILYEMLTGRDHIGRQSDAAERLPQGVLPDRRQPPSIRRWNSAVSRGVESIVGHCLALDPAGRYQTARELTEDLRRQLEHRELKYATDPSPFERAQKWARRHPRLSSSVGVAVVVALAVAAVAQSYAHYMNSLARIKAEQVALQARAAAISARQALHEDLKAIEFLLASHVAGAESEQRIEGLERARRAIDRHRVMELPDWRDGPLVTTLEAGQRKQVLDDMGELLMLEAWAEAQSARTDLALRLSGLAAACYPQDATPRAWWEQRAELVRLAGQKTEAQRLAEIAGQKPARSPRDRYLLLLVEGSQRGQLPEKLPLLEDASRSQKDNFGTWMILGNCYAQAGAYTDAVDCYEMAGTLRPDSHWPALCRGMAYLELPKYAQARAAFTEVIRLKPDADVAYYDRALASYHLGDHSGAYDDLTHLLDSPKPALRAYFLRARIRAKRGDRAGSLEDRERALRGEPRDERDWTARGLERQASDPQGALADYQAALKLAPRYLTALQNMANVLAERLGRTEEAIAALDTLLGSNPGSVPARAGRGVLHARLGHRQAALADAREAIQRDGSPFNTYQVAGVYALTSRQNPDDRHEALRLLRSALNRGFGRNLVDKDHDLDPIRSDPEFRQLINATSTQPAGPNSGERKS